MSAADPADRRTISILENISDGVNIFDREWRYVYVNPAGARMVHRTPDQLLGQNVWELWPAAADSPFGVAYRKAMAEQVFVQVEAFYPEPLNIWYEVRCHPSPDGLTLFFNDITERKRTEEALKDAQAFNESTLNAMQEVFFVFDYRGRFLQWNKAVLRVTGYNDPEIAAMAPTDFIAVRTGRASPRPSRRCFRRALRLWRPATSPRTAGASPIISPGPR